MPKVIYTEGAERLKITLKKASQDLSKLKEVNQSVGKVVVESSRPWAPRRSGQLQATVRSSGTKTAAVIRAGNNRAVPYANPIHWGWPRQRKQKANRHPGIRGGDIRPYPWLSRAAQKSEPRWFDLYLTAIDDILDKVKGA